ncbi:MAG: hypothetical protein K2W79_12540 [Hydrotalea flava]|nr:hypothetical protein [Hydrotalea flava]
MTKPLADVKQSTQYFDGLGRPLQTVVKQGSLQTGQSPTDMVSPVHYDEFGREQYQFLSFSSSENTGNFKLNPFQQQQSFYQTQLSGQNETFYYGKTIFEPSPLNRVQEAYSPGNSWVGSEANPNPNNRRSVKVKYWLNTSVDAVRYFTVTDVAGGFGTYATPDTYYDGQLTKSAAINEQGNQVIEFKDKEGKLILRKIQAGGVADDGTGLPTTAAGWICTYYVYDIMNRLRLVIQPEGVKAFEAGGWQMNNSTLLAEQCFRYEYDDRNRMITKKLPGAGEIFLVYDGRDRLVMSQDANLRAPGTNKWMVTLYDALNRPVQTGLLLNTWNNKTVAQHRADAANSSSYPFTVSTVPSTTFWEYLSKAGYDDYSALPVASGLSNNFDNTWAAHFMSTYNTSPHYAQEQTASLRIKGMPTWTETKVLGSSTYIYTVMLYDEKGRVIQVKQKNNTGGEDVTTTQYDWAGKPLVIVTKTEKAGAPAQSTVSATKFTYDDLGRVTTTEKKIGNSILNTITNLAATNYNVTVEIQYNKLGQVKQKKLAPAYGTAGLETQVFDYNIQGWLLGINRSYLQNNAAQGSSKFAFELAYDKSMSSSGQSFTSALQYNGNITGVTWKSDGDGVRRMYSYGYDAANRLLKADFIQHNVTENTWNNSKINYSMQMGDGVNTATAYDANGNIKAMQQYGWKLGSNSIIDNLTYNYHPSTSRLLNVIDATNDAQTKLGDFRTSTLHPSSGVKTNTTVDYTYDDNGNLKKDLNKDIGTAAAEDIVYNHLNLIESITVRKAGGAVKGVITYTYDAAGTRLRKTTNEGNNTTITNYVGGCVYETKVVNGVTQYTDKLQFTGHEEGRIRALYNNTASPHTLTGFAYDYLLKDHLGSVRMTLTDELKSTPYIPASLETAQLVTIQPLKN